VSKGLDADPGETDAAGESVSSESVPPAHRQPWKRVADEVKRAAKICAKGKEAVVSMFRKRAWARPSTPKRRHRWSKKYQLGDAQPGCLISLARLKTADDYTFMHSVAVCALMIALPATRTRRTQVRDAGMAGLLHDLGKAMIPLEVLNKPGKLTDEEFDLVKTHPAKATSCCSKAAASARCQGRLPASPRKDRW
jgi:HD-GYP domain-containing protein (c-di-GMP phosphodiesterase class II)